MNIDSLLSAVQDYLTAESYAQEPFLSEAERQKEEDRVRDARLRLRAEATRCSQWRARGPAFRRVLVAVDGSEPSTWAASAAAKLAADSGAALALAYVLNAAGGPAGSELAGIYESRAEGRKRGAELLSRVAAGLRLPEKPEQMVVENEPTEGIVQAARDWGADLIVMGTHGRGRIASFVIGSVADGVIRRAHCPVLTVAQDPLTVRKVKELLDSHGIRYVTVTHSLAYTALDTASSAHVRPAEMAKTVMIKAGGELAMFVIPATEKVDRTRFAEMLDVGEVTLADEDEFKSLFPDCEAGAMPPFGNLYGLTVYVADGVAREPYICFNAGSHCELIRMAYRDFETLVRPTVVDFVTRPAVV